MPAGWIAVHLLISGGLCFAVAKQIKSVRAAVGVVAVVAGMFGLGLAMEHAPAWAFTTLHLPGGFWVFVCNLSLELAAVLLGVLWRSADDTKSRKRAAGFSVLLLTAAAASYAWLCMPVPKGLTGRAEDSADCYCPQSSDTSCAAAAAVTLLARHGIKYTEAEMAGLCLTRNGYGTSDLGAYRGLWLAGAPHNLRPRYIRTGRLSDLARIGQTCMITVGLRSDCPDAVKAKMIGFGWEPGVRHAVVVLSVEPGGEWIHVADPSFGKERWPTSDLNYIWDGYALVLE